jgi:hypothetical protein
MGRLGCGPDDPPNHDGNTGTLKGELALAGPQGREDLLQNHVCRTSQVDLASEHVAEVVQQVQLLIRMHDLAGQAVDLARRRPGLRQAIRAEPSHLKD